jgi:hypothetical protein
MNISEIKIQKTERELLREKNGIIPPNTGLYYGMHADGLEYEILYDACQLIKGVEGLTCELGVRKGASSALIMQACIDNEDQRVHIGIDPYGNIEASCPKWEGLQRHGNSHPPKEVITKIAKSGGDVTDYGYTDELMMQTLPLIYKWCEERQVKFLFFSLEDTEFFKRFADGVPVYDEYKKIINKYALVFYDVPTKKDGSTKIEECEFFLSRTPKGGIWVFDDVKTYQHENVEKKLFEWGFELVISGWKNAYRKL